jgi:hypothetical protein
MTEIGRCLSLASKAHTKRSNYSGTSRLTVRLSDRRVLFACADTHPEIIVFLCNVRIAVTENCTGEVRMIASIDGGC